MNYSKWNVYCDDGNLTTTSEKIDEIRATNYRDAVEMARKAWPQYTLEELVVKKHARATVRFKKYENDEDRGSWHYYRGLDAHIKHPTVDLEYRLRGTAWSGSIIWETYDEENDVVIASIPYEYGEMGNYRRELMETIKEYNE